VLSQKNKNLKMFAKLKTMLGLYKFQANARLKDGTELVIEGDLTEGVAVYVVTDEGPISLPDGSYELEDGKLLTVMDGLITDVSEAPVEDEEAPVVEEAEADPEPEAETETEVSLEDKIVSIEERISALEEKLTSVEQSADESKQENQDLKQKNEKLSNDNISLTEKVTDFETKLSKMDGAQPVSKKKTESIVKTSDYVTDRMRAIQLHKKV